MREREKEREKRDSGIIYTGRDDQKGTIEVIHTKKEALRVCLKESR